MIGLLTGKVVSKSPTDIILDVGGVGYHIFVSLTTFERLPQENDELTLYILTYVREDVISLYGFLTKEEKELFAQLLKVSGIGPKTALALLSGLTPSELANAVIQEDVVRLSAIPGIGRKTAERIIVDLKDRLTSGSTEIRVFDPKENIYNDVISALVNLGYHKKEVEKVLKQMPIDAGSDLSFIIKNTLRELSKR
jgi:Holliday junction DNA helicase RuvA